MRDCIHFIHQKCGIGFDLTCRGRRAKCKKYRSRDTKQLKFDKTGFVAKAINKRVLKTVHGRERPKTKPIMKMIERARQELGYSEYTNDYDILFSLYKASRRA